MAISKTLLFVFRSGESSNLFGFVRDREGEHLPDRFKPWKRIGVIRPTRAWPLGVSRDKVDAGIDAYGFQLWRKKAEAV